MQIYSFRIVYMVVMCDIKERTQTEIILEQGAEDTILTQNECNNRKLEKKLHNVKLHGSYSSLNRMIKSRRM
jgi:hypothetical protein